jgi:hypothetical protein
VSELTKQELEAIAAAGAAKAVTEVLQKLGIDADNVRESQADFAHLRKQRLASEQIGKLATRALITIFLTGLCSVFLLGIKDFLHK